jgi:hypothetical protein
MDRSLTFRHDEKSVMAPYKVMCKDMQHAEEGAANDDHLLN